MNFPYFTMEGDSFGWLPSESRQWCQNRVGDNAVTRPRVLSKELFAKFATDGVYVNGMSSASSDISGSDDGTNNEAAREFNTEIDKKVDMSSLAPPRLISPVASFEVGGGSLSSVSEDSEDSGEDHAVLTRAFGQGCRPDRTRSSLPSLKRMHHHTRSSPPALDRIMANLTLYGAGGVHTVSPTHSSPMAQSSSHSRNSIFSNITLPSLDVTASTSASSGVRHHQHVSAHTTLGDMMTLSGTPRSSMEYFIATCRADGNKPHRIQPKPVNHRRANSNDSNGSGSMRSISGLSHQSQTGLPPRHVKCFDPVLLGTRPHHRRVASNDTTVASSTADDASSNCRSASETEWKVYYEKQMMQKNSIKKGVKVRMKNVFVPKPLSAAITNRLRPNLERTASGKLV